MRPVSAPWLGLAALVSLGRLAAWAEIELLPEPEPAQVFGGAAQTLQLRWHNAGRARVDRHLDARLYQASSATAAPFATTPWKTLEILPGQTVIESARLTFPVVNAETRFIIQWIAGPSRVLGVCEVLVYPNNLLGQLRPLLGEEPIGVLDPQGELKPLLRAAGVRFSNLEEARLEDYGGKLVIAGPFLSESQAQEGLPSRLRTLLKKGASLVWLLPPPDPGVRRAESLPPSFYLVVDGKGTAVLAQAGLTAGLADSPQAQLNLVQFARLALRPEAPRWPTAEP